MTSRNENIKKLDGEIAKLKQQLDERGQAVTDGGAIFLFLSQFSNIFF